MYVYIICIRVCIKRHGMKVYDSGKYSIRIQFSLSMHTHRERWRERECAMDVCVSMFWMRIEAEKLAAKLMQEMFNEIHHSNGILVKR